MLGTDVDDVFFHILGNDIIRPAARGDVQPMPLADRIICRTVVPTEFATVQGTDASFFGLDATLEKFFHIHGADKADALTVFFVENRKPEPLGQFPNIRFGIVADRKQRAFKLRLGQHP